MAAVDLTTLQKVKEFIPVTGTGDDALLEGLITAASTFIETYTSRQFHSAQRSERYSGADTAALMLRHYPVTAVAAVSVNGVAVPVSSDYVRTGYVFDQFSVQYIGGRFVRGASNIAVTYTAGYDVIPEDLELACKELVAVEYRARSRLGKVSDAQPQGGSTSYSKDALPPLCKSILDQYERQIPV